MPITYGLIGMSVFVTLLSGFGADARIVSTALISSSSFGVLDEIVAGQVWRLVTPTFIHFDIYHLVFNLLWVWVCGGIIERKQGWLIYSLIFFVAASASNLAQYFFTGPAFGGMSGVVYAFLGYVWMQMRFNPIAYSGVMPKTIVPLMLVWFIVCWIGLIGNVANVSHTAGLIIGVIWGRIDAMKSFKRYQSF